jgi:hypothetical protein
MHCHLTDEFTAHPSESFHFNSSSTIRNQVSLPEPTGMPVGQATLSGAKRFSLFADGCTNLPEDKLCCFACSEIRPAFSVFKQPKK